MNSNKKIERKNKIKFESYCKLVHKLNHGRSTFRMIHHDPNLKRITILLCMIYFVNGNANYIEVVQISRRNHNFFKNFQLMNVTLIV
jgi:hypothetical protein